MRLRNLLNAMDGDGLLRMHEWLPTMECRDCMGTGEELAMVIALGDSVGFLLPTGIPCDSCGGMGMRLVYSYN